MSAEKLVKKHQNNHHRSFHGGVKARSSRTYHAILITELWQKVSKPFLPNKLSAVNIDCG